MTTAITSQARPRPTTRFLTFSPGAAWAKLAGDTTLTYDHGSNFPSDYWSQVDVWIPPETFTACDDGDLSAFTADFLSFNPDGIFATDITPPTQAWRWWSDDSPGGPAGSGPSPSVTYTIEFHTYPSGGNTAIDWYVNGALVISYVRTGSFADHRIYLNRFPRGCCCETYFYTNVKISTARGAGDIFSDDFSGGLGNWTRNTPIFMPSGLAVVAAPVAAACPTLTVSPARGLPGISVTVTGTGFGADRPLQLFFGNHEVEIAESSDGSGNASFTATVPHVFSTGDGDGDGVYLLDDEANVACFSDFKVCGVRPADGITTVPDPLVATGGVTNNNNLILDYIFHDGAHWVLWQDESVTTGLTTFPPPANHTMNATRISADGSTVTDYPIDTEYQWIFGSGAVNEPGLFSTRHCGVNNTNPGAPEWSSKAFFASWAKPILDAHFASDGTTLWVAVLTRETIDYPWLDNLDAVNINPGSLSQFVPLAALTAGFSTFATNTGTGYLRYNTQTDGPINQYEPFAFPTTDAGEGDMGVWSPPCVAMFAFDGAAFNRIGTIEAAYCPGLTNGVDYANAGVLSKPRRAHLASRGSLFSRVSICASPNDPGRCHVVWGEGGDWGRCGLGNSCLGIQVWDGGPQNRSYRVNYTTWDAVGVLTNTDIFASHFDRTSWSFPNDGGGGSVFAFGYSWPDQANFAGLLNHDLRNDNAAGTPYLFAVWPQTFQNPFEIANDAHGNPWLDNDLIWGDTLHVYDLSSGAAVEVQSLDLSTLGMTEAEITSIWTVGAAYAPPYGPVDAAMLPTGAPTASSYAAQDKGFGISLPYDDPELGVPVYLVHLPLIKRFLNQANSPQPTSGNYPARGFYRVPCDMSAEFDYLDGEREIGFSIVQEPYGDPFSGFQGFFYGSDFFSDEKNLWVPAPSALPGTFFGFGFSGYLGEWFDRVCFNTWTAFEAAEVPFVADYWLGSQCPGFHYDPDADSITTVTGSSTAPAPGDPLFAVTTQFLCRGCRNCKCGTGVHIVHSF